ncbi:hypothetical protein KKE03_02155 [Patescibacteria group bacterium]|nr:hypothetical protein [Patescibacteria group bacterium]
MTSKVVKTILLWGIILFVFNYIVLFILMFLFGQTTGSSVFSFVQILSVAFAGYKGVLSYGKSNEKDRASLIKSNSSALVIGGMIAVVSSLLFIIVAFIFSGELAFRGLGIIIGAIGGYLAKQRLQKR